MIYVLICKSHLKNLNNFSLTNCTNPQNISITISKISINHLATPKIVQKFKIEFKFILIIIVAVGWKVKNMIIWNLWDLCLFSRLEICFNHFKHFKLLTNSLNWIIFWKFNDKSIQNSFVIICEFFNNLFSLFQISMDVDLFHFVRVEKEI